MLTTVSALVHSPDAQCAHNCQRARPQHRRAEVYRYFTAYRGLPPRSGSKLAWAAALVLVNFLLSTDEAAVPITLRDVLRVVISGLGLHRMRQWQSESCAVRAARS